MLNVLSGETGGIPVRVRRREALKYRHSYRSCRKHRDRAIGISEKAGWLCAKSEYPDSKTRIKAARHGLAGNII